MLLYNNKFSALHKPAQPDKTMYPCCDIVFSQSIIQAHFCWVRNLHDKYKIFFTLYFLVDSLWHR